jgi:hypothetical protein
MANRSKAPSCTNGSAWNGLAVERMYVTNSELPDLAYNSPLCLTTAADTRCSDSTLPDLVVSTTISVMEGKDSVQGDHTSAFRLRHSTFGLLAHLELHQKAECRRLNTEGRSDGREYYARDL